MSHWFLFVKSGNKVWLWDDGYKLTSCELTPEEVSKYEIQKGITAKDLEKLQLYNKDKDLIKPIIVYTKLS